MIRALSLTCLALIAVGLGGSVALAGKPTIAVLGLEVVDHNGTPTAADTQAAKDLTEGLRARAKAGTGPYQLAPGSDKELIDQKLLNNCDNEAPSCMSAIGGQIGAQVLMYGRLEKQGKSYQVTLKVLDVGRKTVIKSSSDMIPLSEANAPTLQAWAKRMYARLTGDTSGGVLVVKVANADRGTILLDGEPKGTISNGTGQVSGVADGKYRLGVESEGFRRWEKDITVSGGSLTVPVELERGGGEYFGPGPGYGSEGPGPEGGSGSKKLWTGGAVVGGALIAGGASWWIYNWKKLDDVRADQCSHGIVNNGCTPTGSPDGFDKAASDALGDKYSKQTYVGGILLGVGVVVTGISIWKLKSSSSTSERQATRGKRVSKEPTFIVTPVVSPGSGGATLRIDW